MKFSNDGVIILWLARFSIVHAVELDFFCWAGFFGTKKSALAWSFHYCRRYPRSTIGCSGFPSMHPLQKKLWAHSSKDGDPIKDRVSSLIECRRGEGFESDLPEIEWKKSPKKLGHA